MSPVRIIGVGSAHGDDRLGWAVVEALRDVRLPDEVELHCIGAPATELLPLLMDARRVVIVDAIASDARTGTLLRCDPRDLRRADGEVSGHGLSVDSALDLAAALGALPDAVVLLGLAVDAGAARPGAGMTRAVSRALPALLAAVTKEAYQDALHA
jgi:hydrogenase maturation protease